MSHTFLLSAHVQVPLTYVLTRKSSSSTWEVFVGSRESRDFPRRFLDHLESERGRELELNGTVERAE